MARFLVLSAANPAWGRFPVSTHAALNAAPLRRLGGNQTWQWSHAGYRNSTRFSAAASRHESCPTPKYSPGARSCSTHAKYMPNCSMVAHQATLYIVLVGADMIRVPHQRCATTRTRCSEHVLLDPEVRHDLAADFLDRSMRGVERGNVLVAEDAIRDRELALAAVELGI